jgi:glycosyltransferase involved in cell wall biosynthesis
MELALSRVIRGLPAPAFAHSIACLTGEPAIAGHFGPEVSIHCLRGDVDPFGELRRLRRLIQDTRPTVVHARNISAWLDVALVRACVVRRVRLVLSFHGTDHAGSLSRTRQLLAAGAAWSATRVFTVSERSQEMLARWLRLPQARIAVIPNGVDTTLFIPAAPRERSTRVVLGTVGNLAPVKNQRLLLQACAELQRSGHDVELRIAGEGPERPRLTEEATALGVSRCVRLLGHVPDVVGFLQGLDVFVLPSASEAHPNALIEAMACGLPCVVSRVGGIPDVVTDDTMGRLFDAGDLGGLVKTLEELIADPHVRDALGRSARRRVEDRYGLGEMVRRYRDLYSQVARA